MNEFDEEKWSYNSEVEMSLEYFIRPEKKFDSLDALKNQIEVDRSKASSLLEIPWAFLFLEFRAPTTGPSADFLANER